MPRVSVIISIFDQPNAFTFALLGYRRQAFRDFELIVADDGSDGETQAIIEEFERSAGFPVKHVWQENKGYRRARIANEAVRESVGEILLLSDGDCVPHRDFVGVHARYGGAGRFCTGGYVRLDAAYCRTMTRENVEAGEYERQMTRDDAWRFRWQHWKNRFNILFGRQKAPKVYGCNISVGRDAYFGVNGYDENFDGFGKEDSDLRNRLRRYGAKPVSLWGKAWVYHVDDAIDPKIRERRIPRRKNTAYYNRPGVPVYCQKGLLRKP
ncbi:MAG TPA: glycosyltransferase [Planctomycetota bacterium]|nr:glycosyltransferase [Planctomycetota bacterium]